MQELSKEESYVFPRNNISFYKAHMAFVNNLGKFGIFTVIFLIGIFLLYSRIFSPAFMIFSIVFVLILTIAAGLVHQKFAHKIIIDFNSDQICFYLYRKNNAVFANFKEIHIKKFPRHLLFRVKGRKIIFRTAENDDIFPYIDRIMRISGTDKVVAS